MKKIMLAAALVIPMFGGLHSVQADALSVSTPIQMEKTIKGEFSYDHNEKIYEIEVKNPGKVTLEGIFESNNSSISIEDMEGRKLFNISTSSYEDADKNPKYRKNEGFLEKGKYIVRVYSGSRDEANYKFELHLKTLKMNEKEMNNSFKTANPIKINKTEMKGMLSLTDGRDLYSFTVPKRSDVKIRVSSPITSLTIGLYNSEFEILDSLTSYGMGSETQYANIQTTKNLKAGKYYVNIDGYSGFYELYVTSKDLLPKAPIVKAAKKGTTIVKGTAAKNSEIIVKIGNKKYTGKSSSKGTYAIKVPKLKAKKAITVYVKNSNGTSLGKKFVVK